MRSENTTGSPPAQHPQKPECRYEVDLDCIVSPIWLRLRVIRDGSCVFVTPPIFQKALAIDLLKMLAPHFLDCKFLISETGGITCEPAELQRLADEHKELIVSLRGSANPGERYLDAQGFMSQGPGSPSASVAKEVAYDS